MDKTTLIKKHLIRPFLNGGSSATPSWVQIKKATENTINMNPTTEDRDYISDEQPTTELLAYKMNVAYGVTTYKGEPDFELFYDLYKNRYTGSDAQKELLLVYLFDKGKLGDKDVYFAQKWNSTIVVNDFNTVGTVIDVEVNANGTPTIGYVTIENGNVVFTEHKGGLPTFTLLETEPEDWATNYADYFTKDGDTYKSVVGVPQDSYELLASAPEDWATNWTDYYTESEGIYSPVTGDSAPEFATDTYYRKVTSTVAPAFAENTYYKAD